MSLTGATAWPGDPLSSPLEEPSSTASTPRTMKTTTKMWETGGEHWTRSVSPGETSSHSCYRRSEIFSSQTKCTTTGWKKKEKQTLIVSFRTGNELFHLLL